MINCLHPFEKSIRRLKCKNEMSVSTKSASVHHSHLRVQEFTAEMEKNNLDYRNYT